MNDSIIENLYSIWAELSDVQEPPEMLNTVEYLAKIFEDNGDKSLSNRVYDVMYNYQRYGFINGFKYAMKFMEELK